MKKFILTLILISFLPVSAVLGNPPKIAVIPPDSQITSLLVTNQYLSTRVKQLEAQLQALANIHEANVNDYNELADRYNKLLLDIKRHSL